MRARLLFLLLVLISVPLRAAQTNFIGPETDFTRLLKSKANASGWRAALGVTSGKDTTSFGTIGDGVAVDGPAIQSAINYSSANGGVEIILPIGAYRISETLVATNTFTLRGEGTIIEDAPLSAMLRMTNASHSRITGICFIGADSTNNWPTSGAFVRRALVVSASTNVVVDAIKVNGKGNGIWADYQSHGLTVQNSEFTGIFTLADRAWMYGSPTYGSYYLFGGVVFTDSDTTILHNKITGYGQGICGRTLALPYPCAVVQGNTIRNTADNGMYLVQARNATVSGNTVDGAGGTGLKAHGSGNIISHNTITNAAVGVTLFGIGITPPPGSSDYVASLALNGHIFDATNCVWFNGSGSAVTGNTISAIGRHGIVVGMTSDSDPATNQVYMRQCVVSDNTIRGFAGDGTGAGFGIQVWGDGHSITGNIIEDPATNGCTGILLGPSLFDNAFIGFGHHIVQGNRFASTNIYDIGIYGYHVNGVNISGNEIETPFTRGILIEGCTDILILGNKGRTGAERVFIGNFETANSVCTNITSIGNSMVTFEARPTVGLAAMDSEAANHTVRVSRIGSTATAAASSRNYPWVMSDALNDYFGLKLYNYTDSTQSEVEVLQLVGSAYSYITTYGLNYSILPARAGRLVLENGQGGIWAKMTDAGTWDLVYGGSSTPMHRFSKTGVSIGTPLTLAGYLTLPNNTWFYGQDLAGATNLPAIGIDSGNQVAVAPGGATTTIGGLLKMGNTLLITTNVLVLAPGGGTNQLRFINGGLSGVVPQ